jgi:F-box and leucine-rich repeat protein 10/11
VHDEYGRVDPAKVAEPSKPRGSSGTKRPSRPSDESLPGKRIRTDSNENGEVGQQLQNDIDAMIDPALFEQGTLPPEDPMQVETANASAGGQMHYDTISVSPFDQSMADAGAILGGEGPLPLPTDGTTVTVETVKQEPDMHLSTTAIVHSQDARIQPESTMAATEADFVTPRTSKSPAQRHSSRQPKVVERYIPDDHRSPTKPQPKAANSERRGSSAASGQTMVNSVKSRRSSSNTSGTTHQIAAALKQAGSPSIKARQGSRGSTVESEDPDEKLARELQAEEHGLRRRQSMRL